MNSLVILVGFILTVLDLVVSFLGSIGSIGIIDLTDIVSSINKILASFLCFVINIVLPVISISVLNNLFKKRSQSNNEKPKNKKNFITVLIEFSKVILIYIIVYSTVILLDLYTTFLGVGQLFVLDELSNSMRLQSLKINLAIIFQNSSSEQIVFIIAVSIILLTGHFILAGNESGDEETSNP